MPACVANLVNVEVQAPMYGLVFEVASTTTRFPSGEALAVPLTARVRSRKAATQVKKRMTISGRYCGSENVSVIPTGLPAIRLYGLAQMDFGKPAGHRGHANGRTIARQAAHNPWPGGAD